MPYSLSHPILQIKTDLIKKNAIGPNYVTVKRKIIKKRAFYKKLFAFRFSAKLWIYVKIQALKSSIWTSIFVSIFMRYTISYKQVFTYKLLTRTLSSKLHIKSYCLGVGTLIMCILKCETKYNRYGFSYIGRPL